MVSAGALLRRRLAGPGILVAPGIYDGISAKAAQAEGFEALYATGFGLSGSVLGQPDLGILTATEMADRVRALAAGSSGLPLIADGDNGHGGPLNAARLTALYEGAGAAAIQIEDQAFPKRCGHMEQKVVVSLEDACANIKAAVAARRDPDFQIIARTDARATHGLDEALRRGEAFRAAGADILFIEAPQDEGEMAAIAARFPGIPLMANMVEDGKTPYRDAAALAEIGFRIAIFPVSALLVASYHLRQAYRLLKRDGRLPGAVERLSFSGYNELMGLGDLLDFAARVKG